MRCVLNERESSVRTCTRSSQEVNELFTTVTRGQNSTERTYELHYCVSGSQNAPFTTKIINRILDLVFTKFSVLRKKQKDVLLERVRMQSL